MRLISFDIGIKNLAYIILDVDVEQQTISKIVEWNIVNLLDEHIAPPIVFCNCKNKTNDKTCNKPAKYTKQGDYFCMKHAQTHSLYKIRSKNEQMGGLKKRNLQELRGLFKMIPTTTTTTPTPTPDIKEKITKKELINSLDVFFKETCFDEILESAKPKTSDDTNLITIGKNIKKMINNVKNIDDITDVIIENQYGSLAVRMKTIQGMVTQYFIMKHENSNIEYISSQNKLKMFDVSSSDKEEQKEKKRNHVVHFKAMKETPITTTSKKEKEKKEKYKKNKSDSIKHTHYILENNSVFMNWKPFFEESKKQDDLSDCFLQAIWFLFDKSKINKETFNLSVVGVNH